MPKKTISSIFIVVCMLTCPEIPAEVIKQSEKVVYKGTKLGATEKTFVHQHQNEGFVCKEDVLKIGRECVSEVATYGGYPSQTTAIFINDRLVGILVSFNPPKDLATDLLMDDIITMQLESIHGEPTQTRWPDELTKGQKIWSQSWRKKNGDSVGYSHSIGGIGDTKIESRLLYLSSKAGEKLYENARRSLKKDM